MITFHDKIANMLEALFAILAATFSVGSNLSTPVEKVSPDVQLIRTHLVNDIFEAVAPANRKTWNVKEISEWKKLQNTDGSFSDIDYQSTTRVDWGPLATLNRATVWIMATQIPENPFYQNADLEERALLAIHFFASREWYHINWWHREIGLPLTTYQILLILENKIPKEDREALIAATLKGHITTHPSQWPATGQNTIWYAKITVALGVILNRPDWIRTAVRKVEQEIAVGGEQGIQSDESFYQHGKVFYSGGYGLFFSVDCAKLYRILQGTVYAFSEKSYDTLANYILDGQLWLVHGKVIDYSSQGRCYARKGNGDSKQLLPACEIMSAIPGPRQTDFKNCAQRLAKGTEETVGNKYFWLSDFMTQSDPGYAISVKMFSTRTRNADTSPLGEGLKSQHLSDGLTYFYRGSDDQYWDIFPVWDFNRLPGTTEEYSATYPSVPNNDYHPILGASAFVGGVSDKKDGAATFEFKSDSLSGKKAWFFHDSGMVALGTDLQCNHCKPVYTSLNQEWSQSPIVYGLGKSKKSVSLDYGKKELDTKKLVWAYSNKMGYLIVNDKRRASKIVLQNIDQDGTWKSLAAQLPDNAIRGKVTSLWIDHGSEVKNGSYAYAVYPGIEPKKFQALKKTPDFEILANTPTVQAVYFPKDDLVQAIFYQAGKVESKKFHFKLNVDSPIALQLRKKENANFFSLSASSPDQQTKSVMVGFSWKGYDDQMAKMILPAGTYAGSSMTLDIGLPSLLAKMPNKHDLRSQQLKKDQSRQ